MNRRGDRHGTPTRLVFATLRRFWNVNPTKTAFWGALGILGALIPLLITVASGRLLDAVTESMRVTRHSQAPGEVLVILAVMGGLALAGAFVETTRSRSADLLGLQFCLDQRRRIMAAFLAPAGINHSSDPSWQDGAATADNDWLRTLPQEVMTLCTMRLSGVGALLIVAFHDPMGSLVLLIGWVVGLRWKWRRASYDAATRFRHASALRRPSATVGIATSAAAAKDVRLFGLRDWLGARYAREWNDAMIEVWRDRKTGFLEPAIPITVLIIAHAFVVVRIGTAAVDGATSVGSVAVLLQAVLATRGIGGVGPRHHDVAHALLAMPALAQLERTQMRSPDLRGDNPVPTLRHSIRFENVRFTYPGSDREILAGLDIEIPAGSSLAIVGSNGTGKSTLIQLLARLRDPTGGRVTVDGVDLATVDPRSWQESVAAVSQHALRLPVSLRENISGGRRLSDAVLQRAVRDAGATQIVEALPRGWETTLSREFTGGGELSGGEWQRLALARALAAMEGGAQVLVLDEPTAHLDVRAEAVLYADFLRVTRGRTTIVVSHRFSTVRRADRIVVLDAGRVAEVGSHSELVAAGGRYAAMFAMQASRFSDGSSV